MAEINKINSRGRINGQANPVDVYVGKRIRLRRTLLNLSQEKLAKMLGLTFQQVQKYERGMNRIGASRLWDMSKVLSVPVNFFFEGMDKEIDAQSPANLNSILIVTSENNQNDPMLKSENIDLIKCLEKIKNEKLKISLMNSIKEASKSYISGEQE